MILMMAAGRLMVMEVREGENARRQAREVGREREREEERKQVQRSAAGCGILT